MEKHCILIIEDDGAIREGVRILLEGEGYHVREAENGQEGLKSLREETDLVILDVMMPGISGIKTCEEIRKISNVPVLFLTAKGQESDKLLGLMAGGDDYLVKPFSYAELLARVKALIRRCRVYDRAFDQKKYHCSDKWLNQYFLSTGRLYQAEAPRAEELQEFVTKHSLSTEETGKLRKWAKERKIDEFMIFRDKLLLFDLSYDGEVRRGAGNLYERKWKNLYTVTFSDGTAQVYLDEGFAEKYYDILLLGSVLLGFVVCLGIFVSGLKEDVRYIQELEKQVETISQGNLDRQVSLRGKDELAQLAAGLDIMRCTLIQKEEKEKEMRLAQEKLVLGMSHDLRTPLTGLMAYLEILKRQEKNGGGYIDKALDKVVQIRSLSDQMFEYFLVNASSEMEPEPAEDISSVLGDYLSELCALLECEGFLTDTEEMVWKPVRIRVYTDYLGRIINNIISNIQKYGDARIRVEICLLYTPGQVGVCVKNGIAVTDSCVSGTGLGVKNISAMMEKMKGRAEVKTGGNIYEMILWFPAEKTEV